MEEESAQLLHVVMFPYFAFGHISPFVQLSNKLFSHGVRISFFSAQPNMPKIKTMLNPSIQVIPLEFPSGHGLPLGAANTAEIPPSMQGKLIEILDLMQPQIKTLLLQLKPHFVFFDFAQYWLPKLVSDLGIKTKTVDFSVYAATSSSYIVVPSRFDGVEGGAITFEELKKPPPGFPQDFELSLRTFEAMDFMFLFKRFDEKGPTGYERALTGHRECSVIAFKSCIELEGPFIDYIQAQFGKPVLLTGPLVPEPSAGVLEGKWAKWLDQYPAKSVIFCSFGSETFLSDEQIKELAYGLELTGLPFVLVLNFPITLGSQAELDRALPKGFLERVEDRGVVHTGWVQQQLILAHSSVGCYVCHSGFSSVIEAVVNDCQLVLLPFKGDQFFNSKLVVRHMKAGVEVNRREEDGYFGREDIYEAIKTIMIDTEKEPGKLLRENHLKWRDYFLNKEIQDKFISDLVQKIKSMA